MFDVIGVGICIACISYLCCIYTTTLMARAASNPRRREKRCNADSSPQKSADPATNCNDTKTQYTKSTRRRCPCTEARCTEQPTFSVPMARRKICLVSSSFFDYESTEGSYGKCKRPDSERSSTNESKYLFCH